MFLILSRRFLNKCQKCSNKINIDGSNFFINVSFSPCTNRHKMIFFYWMNGGVFEVGKYMHCIYNRFAWLRDPTAIFLNRIYTSFSLFAMKHSFFLTEGDGKNPFDWGTSICTYNSFTVCCFEMKRRSFLRMLNFDVSIIIIVVVFVVSISFHVTAACHNHFSFLLSTPFFFHFAHCVCFLPLCSFLFHFSFDVRRSFYYFLFSFFKYMWNKKFVYYKLRSPIFFVRFNNGCAEEWKNSFT